MKNYTEADMELTSDECMVEIWLCMILIVSFKWNIVVVF